MGTLDYIEDLIDNMCDGFEEMWNTLEDQEAFWDAQDVLREYLREIL